MKAALGRPEVQPFIVNRLAAGHTEQVRPSLWITLLPQLPPSRMKDISNPSKFRLFNTRRRLIVPNKVSTHFYGCQFPLRREGQAPDKKKSLS
jgi:hypothetical protein